MNEGHNSAECWDEIYQQGLQFNSYPFDFVVSFIFNNRPMDTAAENIRVLEVGCGYCNNLFFVAENGMAAYGIDGSGTAIDKARELAEAKGLTVGLEVGDLRELPYEENYFDLIIDRSAIGQNPLEDQRMILAECNRVLKPGGRLLYSPYTDSHSSARDGKLMKGNFVDGIESGLKDVGPVGFVGWLDIRESFNNSEKWQILQAVRREELDFVRASTECFGIWCIVAEKARS